MFFHRNSRKLNLEFTRVKTNHIHNYFFFTGVKIKVVNAATTEEAEKVARCIANSALVKCSWFGSDPNWGRIVDAAGYARVGLDVDKLDLAYNEATVLSQGQVVVGQMESWQQVVSQSEFTIYLSLGMGCEEFEIWSTDLSDDYVNFNKSEK